jgi:hypothetical protein
VKRKERVVIAYSLEQKAVFVSFLLRLHEGEESGNLSIFTIKLVYFIFDLP